MCVCRPTARWKTCVTGFLVFRSAFIRIELNGKPKKAGTLRVGRASNVYIEAMCPKQSFETSRSPVEVGIETGMIGYSGFLVSGCVVALFFVDGAPNALVA